VHVHSFALGSGETSPQVLVRFSRQSHPGGAGALLGHNRVRRGAGYGGSHGHQYLHLSSARFALGGTELDIFRESKSVIVEERVHVVEKEGRCS
jgi:hypothetical protein